MDGITLEFAPEVLDFIVDKAVEFHLGARGLRSIVETIMIDKMYESPSRRIKNLTIDLDYAKARISKAGGQIMSGGE